MFCCRVIVFILLLLSTAAGTCSQLFPLFHSTTTVVLAETKYTVYFWYTETTVTVPLTSSSTITREYTRNWGCETRRMQYLIACIVAVVGCAMGAVACLFAFGHLFVKAKCCLCPFIMLITFISFACFVVAMAFGIVSYTTGACDDGDFDSFKSQGYKFAGGSLATLCAVVGFLLAFLFEICS